MKDSRANGATVLVVDDEVINRIIVRKSIADRYDLIEACSGDEALNILQQIIPDLILLDFNMPGMSGIDVIRVIKSDIRTADIPIVLLTSDADREIELMCLKEGAYDFIIKPCRADILYQRISRIIDYNFLKKNLEEEVARQTAKAEERSKKIELMSLQTVQTLANAIDAKDQYTNGHSTRVSQYAMILAQALGWDEDRIDNLRYSALLHDIGKIGVPDAILNTPKRLKDNEFEAIKTHTSIGSGILKNNTMIKSAVDVALNHHERYDGTGYPNGLAGDEISEEARIVSIADAFDAMCSRRIYRKALSPERVREELIDGRGTQFDPHFLDLFLSLYDNGMFDEITEQTTQTTLESIENTSALLQKVMESFVAQNSADEIDVISGLLSRNIGERAIAEAMQEGPGCFVFFDVDNLKKINDIMGHNAGDRALKLFGDTALANGNNSIACRLGGDEFLMFLKDVDKKQAAEIVTKIFDEYHAAKMEDPEISVSSLSAGLVMSKPDDIYVDVFNKADKALYHVKQNGKADFYFYQETDNESARAGVNLEKLIEGIKNSGSYEGAMNVEFRQFAKLYEYVENLQYRYKHSFRLSVVTLVAPDEAHTYMEELENAMYCMEQSIRLTIRNVDIVTRYSSVQFLVLLFEVGNEDIAGIMTRIFNGYYKIVGNTRYVPKYTIAEIPTETEE